MPCRKEPIKQKTIAKIRRLNEPRCKTNSIDANILEIISRNARRILAFCEKNLTAYLENLHRSIS